MATPISTTLFASIIRRLRKKAGLTREQLAELADCHPSSISRIEGEERGPSLDMVIKLSHGLDRPAWKLVREIEGELP